MTSHASLDTQMLAELKDLLGDNFNELIDRYTSDSNHRFSLLKAAISSLDFKTIYYEAHGIKGSSRNMGANKLAEICGQLEALGHAQSSDGVTSLFQQAELEFAAVEQLLAGYRL